MLAKLLSLLYRLALHHRRKIYGAMALLVPLALLASSRLTISTSQKALLKPDHPVQLEYQAFVDEFGAADALIAVVQGEDPEVLKSAAEALATALRERREWVRNVFYRVDPSILTSKAPYFASAEDLRRAKDFLAAHPDAAALLDFVPENGARVDAAALLERMTSDKSALVPPPWLPPDKFPSAVRLLAKALGEWRTLVADGPQAALPSPLEAWMASAAASDPRMEGGGWLASRDGRMLFLFIQPKDPSDESEVLTPFLAAMRETADRVLAAHPGFQGRVQVGFTGSPAHIHTEAETVFSDVARGVAGAAVLIVLIIFIGFRTLRKTVCILVPLLCGMALSLGAITLTVGRLNLISAAFFAVMFGMGMDFGIYLIRRAEEELGRGASLEQAVETALTKTGRGVLVGGLTTCAAFWGTSLTDFSGFSELGITAGIGIFICLATVFLLTPGLMLSMGLEPKRADTSQVEDKLSSPRARHPLRLAALAVLTLAVLSAGSLSRVHFDYDALKLLPKDSESTLLQRRMQAESDLSANAAVVVADSLDDLRRTAEALKQQPEISRVESLADVIPERQEEKRQLLTGIRRLLSDGSRRFALEAERAERPEAADHMETAEGTFVTGTSQERRAALLAALKRLEEQLEDAQESAFSGGIQEMTAALDEALEAASGLSQALGAADAQTAMARTDAFGEAAAAAARKSLRQLAAWTLAEPVTEETLPPELAARFKSPRGRYAAYVFPAALVWDVDALDQFMAAVRRVTPSVTGFAATHQVFSRMVPRGFAESMLFALLALTLMLFLDLRRPRAVFFALTPVAVGLLLLQGVLELLGVDHNYASVAAYPVLLGYGSDYGVNIVHRWLERPRATAFVTAFTVGKGVLLSAATSIAGLCSIVFARHKGVSDFGAVLLAGICVCLATAVLFLPVLIDLFSPPAPPSSGRRKD